MLGFLLRRLIQAIIVILVVLFGMVVLSHLIPGGAARAALGPRATALQIAQFNNANGYNLPIWDQYIHYLWNLVHGNLGYSYRRNQGVTAVIFQYLPRTIALVGISTVVALIVAIPLGVLQVIRRNKPIDYTLTGLSFIFYAMPPFLLGTILILYFSLDLKWFPLVQPSDTLGYLFTHPQVLVLPVITLAAITIASFSRYMRSSMMETLTEDYVRTAKAKGATPNRVLYLHALRNALLPIVTLLGLSIPAIVSGALITESVFNYPGMGLLAWRAAIDVDIPLLLGTTFIATVATVVGSLLADILYAIVDPRIRYAR